MLAAAVAVALCVAPAAAAWFGLGSDGSQQPLTVHNLLAAIAERNEGEFRRYLASGAERTGCIMAEVTRYSNSCVLHALLAKGSLAMVTSVLSKSACAKETSCCMALLTTSDAFCPGAHDLLAGDSTLEFAAFKTSGLGHVLTRPLDTDGSDKQLAAVARTLIAVLDMGSKPRVLNDIVEYKARSNGMPLKITATALAAMRGLRHTLREMLTAAGDGAAAMIKDSGHVGVGLQSGSLLCYAAARGDLELAKLLLDFGADPTIKDCKPWLFSFDHTPAYVANELLKSTWSLKPDAAFAKADGKPTPAAMKAVLALLLERDGTIE